MLLAVNIFFVLPDNDLNVRAYKLNQYFDMVFFQRWAFFAPPPKFNERLYLNFFSINNRLIKRFEVLEEIAKSKQAAAPFNKPEEIIDYLVSNSVESIIDNSIQLRSVMEYEKKYALKPMSDSLQNEVLHT